MSKLHFSIWRALAAVAVLGVVAAACGGADSGGVTPAASAPKTASSGFVCPEPSPTMQTTSHELNLFVWTEYIPKDMLECFELVYDIKVNRDEFSSNEEMYAKLATGSSNYDLTQPSDYIIEVMIRNGLMQKLDHERLPNLKNIDPRFLGIEPDPGNQYTVPNQYGTESIVYNSATVKNPPTSWADLWKPEYAGRMVFVDDPRVIIGITLLTLGYDVNTQDPAQIESAKPKLQELVDNVKLFDSDSPKTALVAGDADLGIVWNAEALLAKREVPTIEYVFPVEGTIVWWDAFVILKDAPHADAAYAWFNYILQGDVFWLMLRDFPYSNPNLAALDYAKERQPDLYNEYINSPITNTPPDVFKAGYSIEDVGEALLLYDQLWTEVKGG